MSKLSLVCIALVALSACANESPSMTLPEKLAGKTPEQKQEILRLACLNEAEKITGRTSMCKHRVHSTVPVYDPEVSHMKDLCREMTEAYLSPDKARHVALMRQCNDQLAELPKRSMTHVNNMRDLCKLMTKSPSQGE